MRWLFVLLLAANIAYVGWELNREPAADAAAVPIVSAVPRIVLLSEIEQQAPPAEEQAVVDEPPPAVGERGFEDAVSAVDEYIETASATVAADVPAVADEPPTVAVVTGEMPAAQATNEPAQQRAARDLCYTLGPFRELDELRAFTRLIKDHAAETSFRSRDEKEQSMFWVLLESTGSMAQAKALSQQLVSSNIKDYFIISSGQHKYGISLGHFREKERAYRHAKNLRERGFEPVVEPVFRTYTIYWLDYRLKSQDAIPQQVLEDNVPESASLLKRPCQP